MFKEESRINLILLCIFLLYLIHASFLGLSDDEAYYWVLAQKPAWGYAYHPPAVAWMIALFQSILGGWLGTSNVGLVRLPAVVATCSILILTLNWLKRAGFEFQKLVRALGVLLSFAGFFSLSWMIVPDIPLFLGWMLLFYSTWEICFEKKDSFYFLVLSLGTILIVLSKYSGILALISSAICIGIWAPREKKLKSFFIVLMSFLIAIIPILTWNVRHDWASILYQIRDRHQGAQISFTRYLRFWLVEMVLGGPLLILYFFKIIQYLLSFEYCKKNFLFQWCKLSRAHKTDFVIPYLMVWIIPAAAVFCIQPLFSDFKLHWSFIVWWPACIALAWMSQSKSWRWIKYQVGYGITLGLFIMISCHLPLGNWIIHRLSPHHFDARLDVTNDFYGWEHLKEFMRSQWGEEIFKFPVVGSRYQTAAQAFFALNQRSWVTLLPRDVKERDEWPNLRVSDRLGPEWPKLLQPVLYITDNRYQQAPEFINSNCFKLGKLEKKRAGLTAKWIEIWQCLPTS